jgi:stage V sporulation protein B
MCVLNARAVSKYSGFKQEYIKTFAIPALSSAIMGVATYLVYEGIYILISSNTLATFVAIIIAVVVYAVVLLLCKGLSEDEIRSFPKGAALVALAKKLHLLK